MSSARTVTSISPETPVSFWSTFTSRSAWRSCGTSSRTSDATSLCVSSARPTTATASPIASTRRGLDRARPSARHERSASHSPAACTRGWLAKRRQARRARRRGGIGRPAEARQRREARAQRAAERQHDSEHEQQPEAAHHRHRREQQHEEAGGGGEAGGEDRGPAGGDGGHRRLRVAARLGLVEAGLELDGVVHREPDQDRQRRDRGHRQAAARQRQGAERHRRGGEREAEREQPQARAEHERQRARHQQEGGAEQDEDRALDGVGQPLRHHRHPGHDVARALARLEDLLAGGGPDQVDGAGLLGIGEVRAQADLDQRRVLRREQVREARLGDPGPARGPVEHERRHERRVVDLRDAGDPVAAARAAGCR